VAPEAETCQELRKIHLGMKMTAQVKVGNGCPRCGKKSGRSRKSMPSEMCVHRVLGNGCGHWNLRLYSFGLRRHMGTHGFQL
jgi:hypothetical protein